MMIENTGLSHLSGDALIKQMIDTLVSQIGVGMADSSQFIDDDPVRWIETHFRIPETHDYRMPLADYQKRALREALSRDENGHYRYSAIVWSDIKKSAKSVIAAAVALYRAFNTPWGSIKIIANDLKQADSRVSYYTRRAIELHPVMSQIVRVKPSGYFMEFPNRARIEAVPVDPKGEAGGNDDAVFFSELWGAGNKAALRLWTEATLSPTKFGESFRWVETYAGHIGEAPILEGLYKAGVEEGAPFDWVDEFDPPLQCYRNEAARLFCMWNQSPRLPWQTTGYYAQEEAVLTPSEFERVHRNQWSMSEHIFVPPEWWWANRAEPGTIKEMDANIPAIIALDAAVTQDCFGVIMLTGRDVDDGDVDVRYARAWKPPRKGFKIDFSEPEAEIRRLIENYNVVEVVYDPYQLEDLAGRLRRELVTRIHSFNQGADRTIADKLLFDAIRDRRVHYNPLAIENDLTEHILNANQKSTDDNRLRIVKRQEHLKIDLAVALSMAHSRVRHWRL